MSARFNFFMDKGCTNNPLKFNAINILDNFQSDSSTKVLKKVFIWGELFANWPMRVFKHHSFLNETIAFVVILIF